MDLVLNVQARDRMEVPLKFQTKEMDLPSFQQLIQFLNISRKNVFYYKNRGQLIVFILLSF